MRVAGDAETQIDPDDMAQSVNLAILELASIDIFQLSRKPVLYASKDVIANDKRLVESSYL